MNEHQANYDNLDWQHQNNEYVSSLESNNIHTSDLLNNPSPAENLNQQPDLYGQDNYQQNSYLDDYNNFNADINQQSHLYSDNSHSLHLDNQFNQVSEQNQASNPLQTQEYNNSLWENAYQEYNGLSPHNTDYHDSRSQSDATRSHETFGVENQQQINYDSQQRSGGMETINNLSKDHQIGDIITENGKDYKVVDYAPIHGGYDVIRVDKYPDGNYKEQGSTNTFVPKEIVDPGNK